MWTGVSRPMNYTNWATSEPTISDSEMYIQDCMYLHNSSMYDVECDYRYHGFICEENCPKESSHINNVDSKDLVNLGGRNYFFSLFNVSSNFIIIIYVRTRKINSLSMCILKATIKNIIANKSLNKAFL
jgi:hypothetical protein